MSIIKPKQRCHHDRKQEVRARNGTLYGSHCLQCGAQFSLEKCKDCGVVQEVPARSERTSWTCNECKAKARDR